MKNVCPTFALGSVADGKQINGINRLYGDEFSNNVKVSEREKNDLVTLPPGMSAPLLAKARHNNIVDAYNDLIEVLHFHCLPGLGCLHCRLEWYMSTDTLTPYPEVLDS